MLGNKKGVTLLELVISIAMLSISVILLYGMFSNIQKRKIDVESKTANLLKYYDLEQTLHDKIMGTSNYSFDPKIKTAQVNLYIDYAEINIGSQKIQIQIAYDGQDSNISLGKDSSDSWTLADKMCYVDQTNSKASGKSGLIVIACQSNSNANLIDYIKIPIYIPHSDTVFNTDECDTTNSCFIKVSEYKLDSLYCKKGDNNSVVEGWLQSETIDFSTSNSQEVFAYIDSTDNFTIEAVNSNYNISNIQQEGNNIVFTVSKDPNKEYTSYDTLTLMAKKANESCSVNLGDIRVINKKLTLEDMNISIDKRNVKEGQNFAISLISPIDTYITGIVFTPITEECENSQATAGSFVNQSIVAFNSYTIDVTPTVSWSGSNEMCEYEVSVTTNDFDTKKAGKIYIVKNGILCSNYEDYFSLNIPATTIVSQDQPGRINLSVDNTDSSIDSTFTLSLQDSGNDLQLSDPNHTYTVDANNTGDFEVEVISNKPNARITNKSTNMSLTINSNICSGGITKTGIVKLQDHYDCLNATNMFSTTVEGIVSQEKEGTIKLNVVNNRSSEIKFSLDLSDDKNELVLSNTSEEYTVAAGANTTINVAVKSKKDIDTPITNSSTEYTLTINMQESSTCGAVSISKTGTISLQDDSDKEPPSVTISNLTRLLNNNFYSGRVQLDYSATDQTGIDTLYFDVYKNNIKMYTATVNCNGNKSCSSTTSKTFCIFGNAANAANCNSTSLSHLDVSSSYNVIVVAYGKDTKGNMLNTTNITSYISNHEYNGSDLSALQTGCSALLMEDVRWYNMVTLIATNLNGSCSNAISHTGLATNQYLYKANTTSATCTITSKDGVYDSGLNQAICERAYIPSTCSFNSPSGYSSCSISRSNPQTGAVSSTKGCSCSGCAVLCKTSCGNCKTHGYEKGTITMDISKATGNIVLNVSAIPSQAKNDAGERYCYKAN